MQLPSRMVDISIALDNDTVLDPHFMRPKIEYLTGKQNAWMLLEGFPGLKTEDLPDGEGWAFEQVQLATHNGTHMDAPYHYNSRDSRGNPMPTIDQMPLDWYFRPGVKLDFRHLPDGYVATTSTCSLSNLQFTSNTQPMMAPFWDDLDTRGAGTVYTYTTGSSPNRIFNITPCAPFIILGEEDGAEAVAIRSGCRASNQRCAPVIFDEPVPTYATHLLPASRVIHIAQ